MSTFKSENAAVVKALTHPFLAVMVVVAWVAMILAGTDIPLTYEGMAVGVSGSWAIKRTYKEYKRENPAPKLEVKEKTINV